MSLSSDGSTIVAGAPAYATSTQGAAYVFVKPSSGWANTTETAKLTASDSLGFAVAISVATSGDGSTIVAGAQNSYGASGPEGATYVFVKPSSGWASATETAKLTASDASAYAALGASVGVSSDGSTIVAGASQPVANGPGAAYVFVKPSSGWATGSAGP